MRCLAPTPRPVGSDAHACTGLQIQQHHVSPDAPSCLPHWAARTSPPLLRAAACAPAAVHSSNVQDADCVCTGSQQHQQQGHTIRCMSTEPIGRCPAAGVQQQLHKLSVPMLCRRPARPTPACSTWVNAGGQQHSLAPPRRGHRQRQQQQQQQQQQQGPCPDQRRQRRPQPAALTRTYIFG